MDDPIEGVTMTQYHMSKGIKVLARMTLQQWEFFCDLIRRDVMTLLNLNKMIQQSRRDALQHLIFLIKKRCERIKGRGCADGKINTNTLTKMIQAFQQYRQKPFS
eukprot:947203-Ditylum_brightwellii.AAC.1